MLPLMSGASSMLLQALPGQMHLMLDVAGRAARRCEAYLTVCFDTVTEQVQGSL